MKRKSAVIFVLGFVIISLAIFFVFRKCVLEAKRAHMFGTVCAINAALASEVDELNNNLTEVLGPTTEKWKFLTDQQYDEVIKELDEQKYNLDAPTSRPIIDFWGNRLVIACHKLPKGYYDFMVISKGPDRIYGTADDVVSSYGVLPPPLTSGE